MFSTRPRTGARVLAAAVIERRTTSCETSDGIVTTTIPASAGTSEAIVDSRTLVHYTRTTRDGRIVFGWGGGAMGFGGRTSDRLELAPDVRPHVECLLEVRHDCLLTRVDLRGHSADGGAFEIPYLLVTHCDHGQFDRTEIFDVGDEDAARRRFQQLTAAVPVGADPANPRELVARFTRVVPFKALDAQTLKDILKTDVIARMTREFKMEGFELDINETVLDHIVADAIKRETGARGLASTLTRNLEDVAFGSFGIETKGEVRVVMRDGDIAVEIA